MCACDSCSWCWSRGVSCGACLAAALASADLRFSLFPARSSAARPPDRLFKSPPTPAETPIASMSTSANIHIDTSRCHAEKNRGQRQRTRRGASCCQRATRPLPRLAPLRLTHSPAVCRCLVCARSHDRHRRGCCRGDRRPPPAQEAKSAEHTRPGSRSASFIRWHADLLLARCSLCLQCLRMPSPAPTSWRRRSAPPAFQRS